MGKCKEMSLHTLWKWIHTLKVGPTILSNLGINVEITNLIQIEPFSDLWKGFEM
jgi:hypothetical protein